MLLFPLFAHAQDLIPNGGFEDENICTEYSKNCAPEAWTATSLRANYYFYDSVWSHTGSHFTGLIAGNRAHPGVRSFIRTQLLCKLQRGHQYDLEFYVRANSYLFDSIGVYFSYTDFLFDKRYFKDISPQLWVKDGIDSFQYNPKIWQRVNFMYTATGEEQYISIGNFKHGEYAGIEHAEFENSFYFFLDDVSLTPKDIHEQLCADYKTVKENIYNENERHALLEKKINFYMHHPPAPIQLAKTINLVIDTLIIPDIFFATAKYDLNEKSSEALDSFCNKIKEGDVDSLVIGGHTDSIGKINYNQKLSENRAVTVAQYIKQKIFVPDDKLIIRFYASTKPIATNTTIEGRQKNRRVEIYLYSHY
jgi:outer membrane protein OmpA-like peptidoglycan-associated protein